MKHSISHAPNATTSQQWLALKLLVSPWRWNGTQAVKRLEQQFASEVAGQKALAFATGREALYAVLHALGVSNDDEVLLQAYTCIVVPNSVRWNGAKPVYVDIDTSYNIDPQQLEAALTPKTKAIIVQHTFGYPAQMQAIMAFAQKHQLYVIEDCAHALGAEYQGQRVGTFGDAAIFSFGRDKVISAVSGGMATAKSPEVLARLQALQDQAPMRPLKWIAQNILHALFVRPLTRMQGILKLGQVAMTVLQKAALLNKVYTRRELAGEKPLHLVTKMPQAMAEFALDQLKTLDQNLAHRRAFAETYYELLSPKAEKGTLQSVNEHSLPSYLRVGMSIDHPQKVIESIKKKGYIIGNWYSDCIMPTGPGVGELGYEYQSCPRAETLAKRSVNLPTDQRLSKEHQEEIIRLMNHYLSS